MSEWNTADDPYTCPICQVSTVPIDGSGELMILGDAPQVIDVNRGLAFQSRDGGILRTELQRLYLDIHDFRRGNLWLHPPNKSEECLQHSLQHILENLEGVKAILLCGKDIVQYITGYKVSQVSSLQVNSQYWSVPTWASYGPSIVFQSLGEFRLGLSRFLEANLDE